MTGIALEPIPIAYFTTFEKSLLFKGPLKIIPE